MKTQSKKHSLVWGGLLIFFGMVGLAETYTNLPIWAWMAILAAAGLAVLIELNILRDEAIATCVLAAIALPFLVAFLRDSERWGLLISAYVLLAVGIMTGLIGLGILNDLLMPSYVMFAIAIPFFVVYWRNRQQWWPLVSAGIMTLIGLASLIAEAAVLFVVPIALILIGGWLLIRQSIGEKPVALNVSSKINSILDEH